MNKIIIISIALCFLISCQTQLTNSIKPIIHLEKDTFQLGLVLIGDSTNVHLSIKNEGKETLNITNIGYGCGCTKGKLEKKVLKASESTTFEFTYKNGGDVGSFDKTIIFETNAVEPFKILKIIGQGATKSQGK